MFWAECIEKFDDFAGIQDTYEDALDEMIVHLLEDLENDWLDLGDNYSNDFVIEVYTTTCKPYDPDEDLPFVDYDYEEGELIYYPDRLFSTVNVRVVDRDEQFIAERITHTFVFDEEDDE